MCQGFATRFLRNTGQCRSSWWSSIYRRSRRLVWWKKRNRWFKRKRGTQYRALRFPTRPGVLASRACVLNRGPPVDGNDDESVAENAAGARVADGHGRGAGGWSDRRAGAREGRVDLRDRSAHLRVGPLVAGAYQAAADAGA